jgi:predicted DNA-binding WGR domain protein
LPQLASAPSAKTPAGGARRLLKGVGELQQRWLAPRPVEEREPDRQPGDVARNGGSDNLVLDIAFASPGQDRLGAEAPGTSGTRRFEFSEGTSHKYWEVSHQGVDVTVRYGRIGTHGQTNVKSFADESAAAKHAAKMVQEKIDKGYREVK